MRDEVGAHVSTAGGVPNAPARAAALAAVVAQVFTKQPSRWAEPAVDDRTREAFRLERRRHELTTVASHDSYLINLGSPDRVLWRRSWESFVAELRRCAAYCIELVVTHPGNATDGDRASALARNAEGIERALEAVPGPLVLLETTAGSGSALGATFEELADIRQRLGRGVRGRVGVCLDTCHVWAAGHDLRDAYDDTITRLADTVGLEHLGLLHLNDSVAGLGSRRDRHAHIGEGTLGDDTFRRIMTDARLADVPKVIETPKDDDAVSADLRNLSRLRAYRESEPPTKRRRPLGPGKKGRKRAKRFDSGGVTGTE